MSAYSILYIVPVDLPEWAPDIALTKEILIRLGATSTRSASGYNVPNYWEDEETDMYEHTVFFKSDWRVDIDTAFDFVQKSKPLYANVSFFLRDCANEITYSLRSIPEPVRGTTTLDLVSVNIGPFSIPSIDWETVLGRFSFGFSIHGQGMPNQYEQYVEAVRHDPEIVKLLAWLCEKSGKRWDVLLSCSY